MTNKELLRLAKIKPGLIYENKDKALKKSYFLLMNFYLRYSMNEISFDLMNFLSSKIENQLVEWNQIGSEEAYSFGKIKSRRYNGNGQL